MQVPHRQHVIYIISTGIFEQLDEDRFKFIFLLSYVVRTPANSHKLATGDWKCDHMWLILIRSSDCCSEFFLPFPFHPHFAISPLFPYLLLNTQQSHPCTTTRLPVAAHQSGPHLCLQTPCCYVHKPAGEFFTVLCVTPLTFTPRLRWN